MKKWKGKILPDNESGNNNEGGWAKKNWKRLVTIGAVLVLFTVVYSTGYSSGQESQVGAIEKQKEEIDQKSSEVTTLTDTIATLEQEVSALENDHRKLGKEYDAYKTRMQPYEELEEADAELEKVEKEKKLAEEKARKKAEEEAAKKAEEEEKKAEEARKAEEAAKKEEEARKGYDTGITYEQLARTPDDYLGKKVKFSGKVVQVLEGDGSVTIRFAVGDDYDYMLIADYSSDIVSSRILEDDQITIYGTSFGLYTYEATMGQDVTIPYVSIEKIDQ